MPFVILDPTANPDTKLIARDDLEAHMLAKDRFGDCDFAFAFIGDLNLENYAGDNVDKAVVLVVVEKLPESDEGDDDDDDGDAAHEDGDDEDEDGDQPLTVLGFIFAEGNTQYEYDGVWKDALYFGRYADEIAAQEAEEDAH